MNRIIVKIGGEYTALCLGRRGETEATEIVFDVSELIAVYGSGAAVVLNKGVNDASAYPVSTTQDGSLVSWIITDTETAYTGQGTAELLWYVGESLAKTIVWTTFVAQDIGVPDVTPPDPYQSWVDTLTALGAETLQNAQDAEAAQTAAETAQGIAEDASEEAWEYALASKSWAVGGTDTREGEDVDNAMYFADKAEGFAVGEQNGEPVEEGSPYFMNNAAFYAGVAGQAASNAGWVYFYIDDEGYLHYVKTANCDLDFYIDVNGYLHVTNERRQ